MNRLDSAYNIFDLRDKARKRLPKWLFEFVDRGTEDEVALHNNRSAFEKIKFVPRILTDVSKRHQRIKLFDHELQMPIAIAPTGAAGMMWYQGEIELACAAREAGIPFTLSTVSMTAMETIAEKAGGILWFQLYMWADRGLSLKLVERVKAAGFEALIVTVDGRVAPNREYNLRNGLSIPFSYNRRNTVDVLLHPRWMVEVLARYLVTTGMPQNENAPPELRQKITALPVEQRQLLTRSDSLVWDDLRALRRVWNGKLFIKGILHPDDAQLAADHGVDGVVVSNHGGRNLDSTVAPIDVLPEIADRVGHRITVMVDGGFRRGSDIVKALALGAKLVLVGRGPLYGAAVAGKSGVAHALKIYKSEIDRVLAQIGCTQIEELGAHFIRPRE